MNQIQTIIYGLFLLSLLSSCTLKSSKQSATPQHVSQIEVSTADSIRIAKKVTKQDIQTSIQPSIPMVGTAMLAYPIGSQQQSSRSKVSISYSYGTKYMHGTSNVLFYNTKNQGSHFLLDNHQFMIEDISNLKRYYEEIDSTNKEQKKYRKQHVRAGYIFYEIKTEDYNNNGIIDDKDPTYLYVTDSIGKNLRLVSPPKNHLISWRFPFEDSHNIELRLKKDSNQDFAFKAEDTQQILLTNCTQLGNFQEIISSELLEEVKKELEGKAYKIKLLEKK